MSVISKLKVAIGSDTSELEQGLNQSKKRLAGFGEEVRKLWAQIAQAGQQAGAGGGSAGAEQLRALQEQLRRLGAELDKYDAQLKRSQGSGRGAATSFNSLGFSVQQVARELPSLSMSFSQFFLAISNNLPMLADDMKRAAEANKALAAEGKKGVPVWKQVGSALLSWQTALVVGITLLSAYGSEIAEWVKGLFSAEKAADGLADAQKRLKEAQTEGVQSVQEELQKLQLLRAATEDTSRSQEERNRAAAELQRLYPDYLGNIDRERLLAGEAGAAYAQLSENITKTAVARAKFDKLVAAAKEQVELQGTFETLLKSQKGLWEEYEERGIEAVREVYARLKEETKEFASLRYGSQEASVQIITRGDDIKVLEEIIEAYDKLAAKQEEVRQIGAGIDVGGLIGKEAEAAGEAARNLEEALGLEERTLAAIREKISAYEELKNATGVEEQERMDYYTREIARLEELARKTEELSAKRIIGEMNARTGGPVELRVVYGLDEAMEDVKLGLGNNGLEDMTVGLAKMRTEAEATKESFIDLSEQLQRSVAGMAEGFGEGLGQLIAGGGSLKGFAALVGQTFGDMAVNVGKVAIQTGTAVLGIKAALKSLNPWAAIAAGVALVALGTAVKSSLGSIADGGSGSGGTFSGQAMGNAVGIGSTRDYSTEVEAAKVEVVVSGELRAKGNQLVAALNAEETRRGLVR